MTRDSAQLYSASSVIFLAEDRGLTVGEPLLSPVRFPTLPARPLSTLLGAI